MNFKLKALLATAVLTLSANANAISTNNGGEWFMVAFNPTSQNTFVGVLGQSVASWTAPAPFESYYDESDNYIEYVPVDRVAPAVFDTRYGFTKDFSGVNWTSFIAGASDPIKFSVIGIDETSRKAYATAGVSFNTAIGVPTNTNLDNLFTAAVGSGNLYNFVSGTGTQGYGNVTSVVVDGVVGDQSEVKLANAGALSGGIGGFSTGIFGKMGTGFNTQANIGSLNELYQFTENANGSSRPVTYGDIGSGSSILNAGTFSLSSLGELTYVGSLSASSAPIPEADSSAMVLAGLGLMGFIARRRKSK